MSKQQKEKEEYEEAYLTRLPVTKTEKHRQRRLTTLGKPTRLIAESQQMFYNGFPNAKQSQAHLATKSPALRIFRRWRAVVRRRRQQEISESTSRRRTKRRRAPKSASSTRVVSVCVQLRNDTVAVTKKYRLRRYVGWSIVLFNCFVCVPLEQFFSDFMLILNIIRIIFWRVILFYVDNGLLRNEIK